MSFSIRFLSFILPFTLILQSCSNNDQDRGTNPYTALQPATIPIAGSIAIQATSASQLIKPFIIFHGGLFSCKKNALDFFDKSPFNAKIFKNYTQKISPSSADWDGPADYIISCFHANANKVDMVSSLDQNQIDTLDRSEVTTYLLQRIHPLQPIIIVGHSYGGWLSMISASVLISAGFHLIALITIDAISPLDCNFRKKEGCSRAPQDIPAQTLYKISANTENWLNFYSSSGKRNINSTFPLKSSSISAAHVNIPKDLSHNEIIQDDSIWLTLHSILSNYWKQII